MGHSSTNDDVLLPTGTFVSGQGSVQQRLERWRHCVGPVLDVGISPDEMPQNWSTETRGWKLGDVMVMRGHYAPQVLTRRATAIATDQLDPYVLHLNQAPQAIHLDANGRRTSAGQWQLLLSDFAQPRSLRCEGDVLTVFIPRNALDALLPRALDLHGVVPMGACATILASHLQSLASLLPFIARKEAPDAMVAVTQLLATSLAPSVEMLGLARPSIEVALLRQIRQFMEAHLTEQDMGAARICAHFRISRSTLYRLFEVEGGVLSYLQDRRLVRIHALLASHTQRCYLGRLASDFGFKSATHFSRAFRAKFGYSPRETREGQLCATGARATKASALRESTFAHWMSSDAVAA